MGWANKNWGEGASEAEPIDADYYQPMTTGDDDDPVTPTIAETGDIIILEDPFLDPIYTVPNGGVLISTPTDTDLPSPVVVDEVEYTFDTGKSWKYENRLQDKPVDFVIENEFASTQQFDQLTIGCYFTPNLDGNAFNFHDVLVTNGTFDVTPEFAVLQVNGATGDIRINAHANAGDGPDIPITLGKRYWVNLLFDGTNGVCKVSVYDPLDNFNEIASSPSSLALTVGRKSFNFSFGRSDGHGNSPTNSVGNYSWISQIVMKFSGNEPLMPVVSSGSADKGWSNNDWGA